MYLLACAVLLYAVTFCQVRETEGLTGLYRGSVHTGRVVSEVPPCWKRVKANKARFGSNTPADFVDPSCDKDGYFTPLQCRPLMGCYCVDKYGNPTTKPFRSFVPDCRKLIQNTKPLTTRQPTKPPTSQVQSTTKELPPCWKTVKANKARFGIIPPEDFANPSCDKDGYFTPLQCRPLMGCYCVDKYGNPTTKPSSGRLFIGCRNLIQSTTSAPATQVQPTNELPPCWKRVKANKARFGSNTPADFVNPSCDKDGYFSPLQCRPLMGCYCVDKYGKATTKPFRGRLSNGCRNSVIESTTSSPTTQVQPTKEIPPCWKRVKADEVRFGGDTPEDFVSPSCDKDGYFTPVQCRPLMGCYCVDKYGNPTTEPSRGKSFVGCGNFIQSTTSAPTTQEQPAKELPPCWQRVKILKALIKRGMQDLFFYPKCDKDGYFSPVQCGLFGGCYCVDKYGNPTTKPSRGRLFTGCRNLIQSTTSAPATQVQPTNELPPCWKRVKANKARFGSNTPADFVNPSCDKDGYFSPLQCRPLMGCYCVDKYGKATTEHSRDRLSIGCRNLVIQSTTSAPTTQVQPTKELPPCWKRMKAAKAGIKLGLQDISYPRCDKDGYFAPVQCSLLGGCSCVDKYGNRTFQPRGRFFGRPDCGKSTLPVTKKIKKLRILGFNDKL